MKLEPVEAAAEEVPELEGAVLDGAAEVEEPLTVETEDPEEVRDADERVELLEAVVELDTVEGVCAILN